MSKFEVNKVQNTTTTTVQVDGSLAPGTYQFQLVVENDQGILSQPVVTTIVVTPKNTDR
jgi:hypothetical protein